MLARYATGVVVVSAKAGGIDHAATANSFASVSLAPPLVLVCVERDSRPRCRRVGGCVGVSILAAGDRAAARWFATREAAGRAVRGLRGGPGELTGAALLAGLPGRLECRTEAVHRGGDHDIPVGLVVGLDLPDGHDDDAPLLYFRHGFGTIAPE